MATPASPPSAALMGALGSVLGLFSGTWSWIAWIYQLVWGAVPTKKTWLIALLSIGGTYAVMAYGDAIMMHAAGIKQHVLEMTHMIPPQKAPARVAPSRAAATPVIPEARLAAIEQRLSTLEAEIAAAPKRGRSTKQ